MTTTTTDPRPDTTGQRPLLTIDDVAARLNVNVRHVRRLVQDGRIPYIKWGHLLRFDPDEIEAWITQHHIAPERPPLR
jgi:excisionase family DNA binding protein